MASSAQAVPAFFSKTLKKLGNSSDATTKREFFTQLSDFLTNLNENKVLWKEMGKQDVKDVKAMIEDKIVPTLKALESTLDSAVSKKRKSK